MCWRVAGIFVFIKYLCHLLLFRQGFGVCGSSHGVTISPHTVLTHAQSFLFCLKKDKILEAFVHQVVGDWRVARG